MERRTLESEVAYWSRVSKDRLGIQDSRRLLEHLALRARAFGKTDRVFLREFCELAMGTLEAQIHREVPGRAPSVDPAAVFAAIRPGARSEAAAAARLAWRTSKKAV